MKKVKYPELAANETFKEWYTKLPISEMENYKKEWLSYHQENGLVTDMMSNLILNNFVVFGNSSQAKEVLNLNAEDEDVVDVIIFVIRLCMYTEWYVLHLKPNRRCSTTSIRLIICPPFPKYLAETHLICGFG